MGGQILSHLNMSMIVHEKGTIDERKEKKKSYADEDVERLVSAFCCHDLLVLRRPLRGFQNHHDHRRPLDCAAPWDGLRSRRFSVRQFQCRSAAGWRLGPRLR